MTRGVAGQGVRQRGSTCSLRGALDLFRTPDDNNDFANQSKEPD